jgi:glycosyltransferase involved in cell wall biosynthesis
VARTVLPEEKVEVIPYGIDGGVFDPEKHDKRRNRKRFHLPEDGFLIGLVGRIEQAKGQLVAIEAFAKARRPDAHLVLCGSVQERDYFESLQQRAQALGIGDTVHFVEFTSEIPDLVNTFDLSLLPSYGETFGLVVIEAMAAGIPVIGTDAEGVPEIIRHEENGLLVPPRDAEALARAMRTLAEDDGFRKRLGRQARQDVLQRYDYNTQTDKFFHFCRRVHADRRKKRGRA